MTLPPYVELSAAEPEELPPDGTGKGAEPFSG